MGQQFLKHATCESGVTAASLTCQDDPAAHLRVRHEPNHGAFTEWRSKPIPAMRCTDKVTFPRECCDAYPREFVTVDGSAIGQATSETMIRSCREPQHGCGSCCGTRATSAFMSICYAASPDPGARTGRPAGASLSEDCCADLNQIPSK
jgi:hypothetical protein